MLSGGRTIEAAIISASADMTGHCGPSYLQNIWRASRPAYMYVCMFVCRYSCILNSDVHKAAFFFCRRVKGRLLLLFDCFSIDVSGEKGRVTLSIEAIERGANSDSGGSAWLVVWNWWLARPSPWVHQEKHITLMDMEDKKTKIRRVHLLFSCWLVMLFFLFFTLSLLSIPLNRWLGQPMRTSVMHVYIHRGVREKENPTLFIVSTDKRR